MTDKGKVLLFANTDWYLYNFRLSLARRLKEDGWEVVLVSPPGAYCERLVALGFRWVSFAFSTCSTKPLRELAVLLRLVALYRRERPVLVHHFTIKCVLYGSLAATLVGGIRVVNAVTGVGHVFTDPGIRARLLRHLVRALYRFALAGEGRRVIFQNADDLESFLASGLARRASSRLIRGSGVDCSRFKPGAPSRSASNGPPRILFASRLLREKGVLELLEAARSLRKRGVACEFQLAGDVYPENPSSFSAAEVEAVNAEGVVSCLGHVDDMAPLLNRCDIVVLPSYREGTPRILLEAAAMAKPIVATDIAGCRGLVQHEVNGLLVPIQNAKALADALERLISDASLRARFGRAGRRIVLEEFEEGIVLDRTLAVYRELCAPETRRCPASSSTD